MNVVIDPLFVVIDPLFVVVMSFKPPNLGLFFAKKEEKKKRKRLGEIFKI